MSKFSFSNCQNFPFQTVKIFLFKLSKFSFSNCQNFLSKLSKFSFSNCQNFPFQTVRIFIFKLSKFPFQTVKIFLIGMNPIQQKRRQISQFPIRFRSIEKLLKFKTQWVYSKHCFKSNVYKLFSIFKKKKKRTSCEMKNRYVINILKISLPSILSQTFRREKEEENFIIFIHLTVLLIHR
jgi:hypothetical protein